MEELYDEIFAVSRELTSTATARRRTRIDRDGHGPVRRDRVATSTSSRAMLEARATSQAVREMWDADRQSFVEPLAEMIRAERDGRAGPRTDPTPIALATRAARAQRPRRSSGWCAASTLDRRAAGGGGHRRLAAHASTGRWRHDRDGRQARRAHLRLRAAPSAPPGTSPATATRSPTAAGRPVVVMAHGLGGTKDSGLAAVRRARSPRPASTCSPSTTAASARAAARRGRRSAWPARSTTTAPRWRPRPGCPACDPQRLVLWGVSLSGGHVLEAAADRDDVAAVVVADPAGRRARRRPARAGQPQADARCCARPSPACAPGPPPPSGEPAVMMPVVGRPGEVGALTLEGCYDDYLAIAGPTWRNEIDAARRARARQPPARPRHAERHRAARCSCRSPTSTGALRRTPRPRRPSRRGPRCGTTRATTSTSGPASRGSSRRSATRSAFLSRVLTPPAS